MKHGSLFSGIGGFDLAAEWMGWHNVFHCEINDFGRKVLNHYWPNADSLEDITKTDFTKYAGTVDIISGGFPCQPYSAAGKRLGKEDDRHLWPEMLRAIREIQPTWVVGENVLGLVNWNGGLVFEEVQADLEAEGYEVQPYVLPAASVNAPHRRDRVWFVAYSDNNRKSRAPRSNESESRKERVQERNEIQQLNKSSDFWGDATNAESAGRRKLSDQSCTKGPQSSHELSGSECRISSNECNATNANSRRQPSKEHRQAQSGWAAKKSVSNEWQNFPTQPPICGGDDGLPTKLHGITFSKWRNESIKAYGNAIVPQVVYQIFKAIEEYEITLRTPRLPA